MADERDVNMKNRTCSLPDCDKKHYCGGLCRTHVEDAVATYLRPVLYPP